MYTTDELLARLKARVSDPLHAVDAATWVEPMPVISPPATLAELDAAECVLGFALPELLRRLYLEVGNGGFGPDYGLEGVPLIPPDYRRPDIVALYQQYSQPAEDGTESWSNGLVPLASGGCLYMHCVDCINPPHSVATFDPSLPGDPPLKPLAESLHGWLELWLEKSGRRWRQSLLARGGNVERFSIPPEIVAAFALKPGSRRRVAIDLGGFTDGYYSRKSVLQGCCTISQDLELCIPQEFAEALIHRKWFQCHFVPGEGTEELHWYIPGQEPFEAHD
ncbi:MAG: SMI1/KNR4 family protein [Tepidisphaeraceae bacterium]|jgi:hypothetical protein